jgi:hypothetical protein
MKIIEKSMLAEAVGGRRFSTDSAKKRRPVRRVKSQPLSEQAQMPE